MADNCALCNGLLFPTTRHECPPVWHVFEVATRTSPPTEFSKDILKLYDYTVEDILNEWVIIMGLGPFTTAFVDVFDVDGVRRRFSTTADGHTKFIPGM